MIEKIKSQTYQKITKQQQDIKDILNQPNATFKNNKGEDKERHDGLTIKFSNKTNKKPLSSEINDNLSENEVFHYAEDNIYVEEKRTNNFPKYTYNSVRTCLGSF